MKSRFEVHSMDILELQDFQMSCYVYDDERDYIVAIFQRLEDGEEVCNMLNDSVKIASNAS